MEVGLFFGSFNPIHIGHLIIAETMLEFGGISQVWFVVSPQNPLKKTRSLIHEFDRLNMVEAAIHDNDRYQASDVEFHMPRPSYTIDTLTYLREKHENIQFRLIIGGDNLKIFPKWKNSQRIVEDYGLLVYPRPGFDASEVPKHHNISIIEAPSMSISATFIRKCIKENRSVRYLVPKEVEAYIRSKKLYY